MTLRTIIAIVVSLATVISGKADNHDEFLPDAKIKAGTTKLTFEIKNYNPNNEIVLSLGNIMPLLSQEYLDLNIPLDRNGKGTAEIPMFIPQLCTIEAGNISFPLLLAPDKEIGIILQSTGDSVAIDSFSGFMAQTHKELSVIHSSFLNTDAVNLLENLIGCTTPQQRLDCLKSELERQKNYANSLPVNESTKAILRMSAESEYLSWLYNFGVNYIGRQTYERMIEIPSPEDYGRIIAEANALLPAPPAGTIGIEDYFEILGAPYASCMDEFWTSGTPTKAYMGNTGTPNEYNRDLLIIYNLAKGKSSDSKRLTESMTNDDCRLLAEEYLKAKHQHEVRLSQADNVFCHTYDDVTPDSILQVLLDKYSGRTVVIDIWATWCGPCLLAHKEMEPMKKELKDKDIVFLYLTSDVSPLAKWEPMVQEIEGEHFYLTNEQLYSILELYQSTGFPTYAVYDDNSTLVYSGIGFPGVDKIKSFIAD